MSPRGTIEAKGARSTMQKVLLIEDDDALNEHVCELLRRSGYRVSNAFNGEDGLIVFQRFHPDFVIVDIFMPRKDGLEVLLEIRKQNSHTKIILISGQQYLLSNHNLKMAQ